MTAAQTAVLVGLLLVCYFLLVWMIIKDNRPKKDRATIQKADDRDQVLEMLCKMDDHFSASIYKKVYKIEDSEIAEKKKELNQNAEAAHNGSKNKRIV